MDKIIEEKINELMKEADIYENNHSMSGLQNISKELSKLTQPYEDELNNLMENEAVKKYMDLKAKINQIDRYDRIIVNKIIRLDELLPI